MVSGACVAMHALPLLRPAILCLGTSACTLLAQPDEELLFAAVYGSSTSGGSTSTASSGGGDGGSPPGSGGAGGEGGQGGSGGRDACDGLVESPPPPDAVVSVPGVVVSTLAGSEIPGHADGSGAAARFDNPVGVAFEDASESRVLVTDFERGLVRRVTRTGVVTTVVPPQDGFFRPFGIARAADGAVFVETDGNTEEQLGDATGTLWRLGGSGLGGPRVVLENVGRPRGLVGWQGTLAAADVIRHVVRKLEGQALVDVAGVDGCAGFVDGMAEEARFEVPYGMAVDREGAIVIADRGNHAIRRITPDGFVMTIAGTGSPGMVDGSLGDARFREPIDVAIDDAGRIVVSDVGNHRVRRIDEDAGEVVTLAGDGEPGFADGTGIGARFFGQEGIEVTRDGRRIYVADGTGGLPSRPYHRIRLVEVP